MDPLHPALNISWEFTFYSSFIWRRILQDTRQITLKQKGTRVSTCPLIKKRRMPATCNCTESGKCQCVEFQSCPPSVCKCGPGCKCGAGCTCTGCQLKCSCSGNCACGQGCTGPESCKCANVCSCKK
ncbi:metallothionein-like [Saccostrea cucullata]|uniref:metallothionein-like n=1 Tax=Saccostrea cuccullata TaxID=36930 RepID=UPI002ED3CFC7